MLKRIGLFLLVNLMVIATIGIITSALGVRHYITAQGIDFSALPVFSLISPGISRRNKPRIRLIFLYKKKDLTIGWNDETLDLSLRYLFAGLHN